MIYCADTALFQQSHLCLPERLAAFLEVYRNAFAAFLEVYRNAFAAFLEVYRNAFAAFHEVYRTP